MRRSLRRAEDPFAYAAVQDTVTGRLEADLNSLIITPDSQAILELVRDNKELLTASPDHASLAVIALRRSGHADVAIVLAERVLLEYGHHRRLDFERAVTYGAGQMSCGNTAVTTTHHGR